MADEVTIVDYHAGNLTSVRLAVQKLGREAAITNDPDQVRGAERLIFPGVGAAGAAMTALKSLGLDAAIADYADTGRPLLGICLGAQVILEHSDEGDVACLGLIQGRVVPMRAPEGAKVPHMGWNDVEQLRGHPIWDGVEDRSPFYFVHSYVPAPADDAVVIGVTHYHGRFVSVVAQGNVVACQFHPERSGRIGLRLLENFLRWNP